MVVRFVCVVCVPLCVRVSRVSRACPGSPRCLFTGRKVSPTEWPACPEWPLASGYPARSRARMKRAHERARLRGRWGGGSKLPLGIPLKRALEAQASAL